ncbi:MAG TPA: protein kinase [Candidatus Eisenbacteria bacterium]|nr:protein kinase [Candidatus Eisenbacteria bacterium]
MILAPGSRLGPYELLALLGAGGMGEVYRARDTRLGRHVAVKVIPRDLARDRRRVQRFELEARAAGALNHPNIVSIFDVGTHRGTRFVVMELAEGHTLREIVKRGPLPERDALEIAAQAAEGLDAAHAKGIVHRDLTPGNVMVSHEGRVKILDFGLAKLVRRDASAETDGGAMTLEGSFSSEEGSIAGTVPYMAPEQIRGEKLDARTDLFSLGILLYEMVTQRRPFGGDTPADIASSILRDRPIPPRDLRADLTEGLNRVVARCLEKDPALRYGSARELRSDLLLHRNRLEEGFDRDRTGAAGASHAADATVHERAPARVQGLPSIAVLPFANRSHDPDDEYFSDGLADELLNVLTKIPGLRVAGRTSSYQFKGRSEDLREIGRKLNVATLLEGTVRKSGNRVRISVQLVQASDGYHLWAQSYDRMLDDIFAVQDDIAQSVVKELRTTLLGEAPDSRAGAAARADVATAARGRGESGEAYRLLLHGRHLVHRGSHEDLTKGVGYLIEALQLEPTLALAWADLSAAYAMEAGYGWYPIDAGNERARKAAMRALELEPNLAEGHVRLGAVQMNYDRDWKAAEASFRRALDAAPGNPSVLRLAGNLISNLGRLDEAIELYRRAVEQDPLSAAGYQVLGIAYHAADRLKEAEEAFRMAIELGPDRMGVHYGFALVLLARGRGEEALDQARLEREEVYRLWSSSVILHHLGRGEESEAALQELIRKYGDGGAYQVAEVYAARGEVDAAFRWLERAYELKDGGLSEMKPEPSFRSLHGDPRWSALLARVGLT